MVSIEDLKAELVMRVMSGNLNPILIGCLPVDDELRTLTCSFDSNSAYTYALAVDRGPHDETRTACIKDPRLSWLYALNVDKCDREDTRKGAYKNRGFKSLYIHKFGGATEWDTDILSVEDAVRYTLFYRSE
jgi:hypothetical protein